MYDFILREYNVAECGTLQQQSEYDMNKCYMVYIVEQEQSCSLHYVILIDEMARQLVKKLSRSNGIRYQVQIRHNRRQYSLM